MVAAAWVELASPDVAEIMLRHGWSTLIIDGKLHEGDTVVVESDKSHGVKLRVA